jgi:hypothetical protein
MRTAGPGRLVSKIDRVRGNRDLLVRRYTGTASAMPCGPPAELSAKVSVPVVAPVAVGENTTPMLQIWLYARVMPVQLSPPDTMANLPEIVSVPIFTGALPVLVTTTSSCVALVVPTICTGNCRLAGVICSVSVEATPTPVRFAIGLAVVLSANVTGKLMLPVCVPVADGVKLTAYAAGGGNSHGLPAAAVVPALRRRSGEFAGRAGAHDGVGARQRAHRERFVTVIGEDQCDVVAGSDSNGLVGKRTGRGRNGCRVYHRHAGSREVGREIGRRSAKIGDGEDRRSSACSRRVRRKDDADAAIAPRRDGCTATSVVTSIGCCGSKTPGPWARPDSFR